jgi:hypothetical protein
MSQGLRDGGELREERVGCPCACVEKSRSRIDGYNGRALQELLQRAAPRYVKALKRERTKAAKSKKS